MKQTPRRSPRNVAPAPILPAPNIVSVWLRAPSRQDKVSAYVHAFLCELRRNARPLHKQLVTFRGKAKITQNKLSRHDTNAVVMAHV